MNIREDVVNAVRTESSSQPVYVERHWLGDGSLGFFGYDQRTLMKYDVVPNLPDHLRP